MLATIIAPTPGNAPVVTIVVMTVAITVIAVDRLRYDYPRSWSDHDRGWVRGHPW